MASSRKEKTAEQLHYDEYWSREAATLHAEGADADDERFQCLGFADQKQRYFRLTSLDFICRWCLIAVGPLNLGSGYDLAGLEKRK